MALSELQRRFAEEFLFDGNVTAAAGRCGLTPGAAYQHHKNPAVLAEIDRLRALRSARTAIDADWVLTRLADEAEADMADVVDDEGRVKPLSQWPKIWRQGLISSYSTYTDVNGNITARVGFSDRTKRLELIGKHIGVRAFEERIGIDVTHRHVISADPVDGGRPMLPEEWRDKYLAGPRRDAVDVSSDDSPPPAK